MNECGICGSFDMRYSIKRPLSVLFTGQYQRLLECITPTMQSCSHMSERRSFKKHIWYEKSENESIHIKLLKFDTIMHGFTIGIFWKSTWVSAFVFSLNVWTLSISNLSSNMQRKDTGLRLKRKWRTNK